MQRVRGLRQVTRGSPSLAALHATRLPFFRDIALFRVSALIIVREARRTCAALSGWKRSRHACRVRPWMAPSRGGALTARLRLPSVPAADAVVRPAADDHDGQAAADRCHGLGRAGLPAAAGPAAWCWRA